MVETKDFKGDEGTRYRKSPLDSLLVLFVSLGPSSTSGLASSMQSTYRVQDFPPLIKRYVKKKKTRFFFRNYACACTFFFPSVRRVENIFFFFRGWRVIS